MSSILCVNICSDGAKAVVDETDGALAQIMAGVPSRTRHFILHSHVLSVKKKTKTQNKPKNPTLLVKNALEEAVRNY